LPAKNDFDWARITQLLLCSLQGGTSMPNSDLLLSLLSKMNGNLLAIEQASIMELTNRVEQ